MARALELLSAGAAQRWPVLHEDLSVCQPSIVDYTKAAPGEGVTPNCAAASLR